MTTGEPDPEFIVVGHLSKPHGTKGEIFVWPLTDRPDSTFAPGTELRISDSDGQRPDSALPGVEVEAVRPYRKGFLVQLAGIADRSAADLLRGRYLLRRFSDTDPLDPGELFYHQLLGMQVLMPDGTEVGRVQEVYHLRPADLLEIRGPERDHLVPFTRETVVGWDLETGSLTIDPPAGLLDL
ncbi:MAG: ribosome maturation factor RimM [Gemmatimonadota bacterium]